MESVTFKSDLSNIDYPESEKVSCRIIGKSILSLIRKEHPEISAQHSIAAEELNLYRQKYIANYLTKGIGELSKLESVVHDSLNDNESIVNRLEDEIYTATIGQKIADKVASFGGSWKFIILFGLFILVWVLGNIFLLANRGFDPYPFILLNLILSCIAALQAPVIMMSQNRQEEKDRARAKNDYMINLKSELEIRMLHEKLDHLMLHQQQELIEIQKIQLDMMNDILGKLKT
jgi:uncharacterized membrane protein